MRNHYTAAIQGTGFYKSIRRACASRFGQIRAFVMIPSESEKLTLTVTRNAQEDTDTVNLTRRNWRTGEETVLYNGDFMGGTPKRKRLPRD